MKELISLLELFTFILSYLVIELVLLVSSVGGWIVLCISYHRALWWFVSLLELFTFILSLI